jgi:hypothetical protein
MLEEGEKNNWTKLRTRIGLKVRGGEILSVWPHGLVSALAWERKGPPGLV